MLGLIGMIQPLLGIMILAVTMGVIGNLMASFITVLGGYGLLTVMGGVQDMSLSSILGLMVLFACLRGVLRYAEQACNHYIAFKLLARIRHKVFAALRKLCPAKLDGSEKGNLVSLITSDIELLEVFYAHTISPIAIAVITSLVLVLFLGWMHPLLGVLAGICYIIVGAVIPLGNSRRGKGKGQQYRNSMGGLNTAVLDNLYGLEEIRQFGKQDERMETMAAKTDELEGISSKLKKGETKQIIVTDWVILSAGIIMAAVAAGLVKEGSLQGWQAVISVIVIMSSFGPTAALSALSNNLNQTLASGKRVLDLLKEVPVAEDVTQGAAKCGTSIQCDDVTFSYKEMESGYILNNFSHRFLPNQINGILGKSGCGKSTLLKLLMRFYETDGGSVTYDNQSVTAINTKALRSQIAYVTQETFLFHDTIENNLKIAKEHATREEIIEAAKKASIHEFIESLPNGYETRLNELGDSISGGEKQRLGIARAFLHGGTIMLLDEPTSNVDSLNEGIILHSLEKEKKGKTILLVSHRRSTMGIADTQLQM